MSINSLIFGMMCMMFFVSSECRVVSRNTTSSRNQTDISATPKPSNYTFPSTVAPTRNEKRQKIGTDVWRNYDQVGAKNFIVVTVAVYSLLGTLSLLLMRMCRRAQRIHNETDRSDELVDQYLRVSMDLKAQGYRDRMLREKNKTCMTLTSIEEERLQSDVNSCENENTSSSSSVSSVDDIFLPGSTSPTTKTPLMYNGKDASGEFSDTSQ